LNNFTKSGWKSLKGAEKKTRSQNEGLDYCGLAEIEAGDVRDGKIRNLANQNLLAVAGKEVFPLEPFASFPLSFR